MQQGFEPKIFTDAFPRWEPFPREGIDDDNQISEESEESKSDSDSETESKKITTSATGKSTAAASEAVTTVAQLTDEQKKKMASY